MHAYTNMITLKMQGGGDEFGWHRWHTLLSATADLLNSVLQRIIQYDSTVVPIAVRMTRHSGALANCAQFWLLLKAAPPS